jgi:SAM-dependent methyltransferase
MSEPEDRKPVDPAAGASQAEEAEAPPRRRRGRNDTLNELPRDEPDTQPASGDEAADPAAREAGSITMGQVQVIGASGGTGADEIGPGASPERADAEIELVEEVEDEPADAEEISTEILLEDVDEEGGAAPATSADAASGDAEEVLELSDHVEEGGGEDPLEPAEEVLELSDHVETEQAAQAEEARDDSDSLEELRPDDIEEEPSTEGEPAEEVEVGGDSLEELRPDDIEEEPSTEGEPAEEVGVVEEQDEVGGAGQEARTSSPPAPPVDTPATEQTVVESAGEDEPPMVAIPEEDVRRDYRVALERKALETAAEVIPPEFLVEEGAEPPRPPRPRRPRRPRRWYEEIFDDEFLMLAPSLSTFQRRREIDFIEKGLGLRPGAMVLDLACGTGMQAIEMARRGYNMVALDLSVAMLAIAGEEAQEKDQKINFLHGDMRDLQFGPTFDGVYCIGSSFGYFDEDSNAKVLRGIHRALKPGGVLLLEVDNRDYVMRSQPNLLWFEGDGFIAMEETSFDFISSRFAVKRTLLMDEGGKKVMEYSMRIYSLHELGNMLHSIGFAVHSVGGHRAAPGAFFGEESPRIIISCQKRAEEAKK